MFATQRHSTQRLKARVDDESYRDNRTIRNALRACLNLQASAAANFQRALQFFFPTTTTTRPQNNKRRKTPKKKTTTTTTPWELIQRLLKVTEDKWKVISGRYCYGQCAGRRRIGCCVRCRCFKFRKTRRFIH